MFQNHDTASLPGSLTMFCHQGRDQIARAISEGGWEAFERPMSRLFFAAAAAASGLVVDIGSNTGFYALLACAASPDNHVLAFEPDPTIHALLLSNICANGLDSRITVSPLALSNTEAEASLYIPDPWHGLIETSSSLEASFKERHVRVVPVQTARLDDVVDPHR